MTTTTIRWISKFNQLFSLSVHCMPSAYITAALTKPAACVFSISVNHCRGPLSRQPCVANHVTLISRGTPPRQGDAMAGCVEPTACGRMLHTLTGITHGAHYCIAIYGQLNELPLSSMSLMRVSMGVLPTRRTKNSCSMTCGDTVRREGSRSSSFPKRVGWLGYWQRTYSSRAHWDFSCRLSMCPESLKPLASATRRQQHFYSAMWQQSLYCI